MKIVILVFISTLLMHCQIVYVKSPEYVDNTETVILVPPPPVDYPPAIIHPPVKPRPFKPTPQPAKDNGNNFGKRPDRPEFERPERNKPVNQPQQIPNTKEKPVRPAR